MRHEDHENVTCSERCGNSVNHTHALHTVGRRKKTVVVVIALVIILLTVIASIAYYSQRIQGAGYASSTSVAQGSGVQFDFNPTRGVEPFTYSWSFGDGTTSLEKSPYHRYVELGTYVATVTVTDKTGADCHWSTSITVRTPWVVITRVAYPPDVAYYPAGSTYSNLFIDGVETEQPALDPGITYSIRLEIIGVIDLTSYGGEVHETVLLNESGTVTAPDTTADWICTLCYDPWDETRFYILPPLELPWWE